MAYRNGNYAAFYVSEPFNSTNLGANQAHDFCHYNLLKAWKGKDDSFPFNDSHDKNYNVRDGSDWEKTLKPRLRDRLNNSKNIVLFLSGVTKNSNALREEIDHGINTCGLPVIVIYPDFKNKSDVIDCKSKSIKKQIEDLWDKLPIFRDSMKNVPTLHIPYDQSIIKQALNDTDLMVNTKCGANKYFYSCE